MKILILGYSNLLKKRILKVLIKKNIDFCIASKSFAQKEKKASNWYRNYNYALNHSNADLVYISLPNSLHYLWSKKALEKNYHVIVDKPLCENYTQAKKLVKIAKRKKKLLAEATFFNYHKQFIQALKLLKGSKNIKFVNTNFIIPMPKKDSFRMNKKLGGGCIMDMGSYAASTARLLGSGKLINMNSHIFKDKNGVVMAFHIFCKFKNNNYFGYFCFGGEYRNNMFLISNKKHLELNNVFSPPSNKNLKITIKENNTYHTKKVNKDDVFNNFFKKIMFNLKKKKFNEYYSTILEDAKFRKKLID